MGKVILIAAPKIWEPVFFNIGDNKSADYLTQRAFSMGIFDGNCLVVKFGSKNKSVENWCCINDREHCSPGWSKEWEPKE